MLSIQTNVNSLVAQQNLNVNDNFMSQTIDQLTSGYRINSSGDDAAGLAVANQLRDNISQVTQGVANGNDAAAQLQIMDGGVDNISQILDRLQTLATQSASATFTGDRGVLNTEFQTDIGEINRQAQSIGLNTGGAFSKNLAVYVGGGSGSSASATTANGTVSVNLSNSVVDAQALGLNGVQTTNSTAYDLSASSASSVSNIIADTTDNGAAGTTANFSFAGAGYGDTNAISINVNLSGVASTSDLVNNINAAIQTAAQGTSGYAAAFKAANITASIVTNSAGQQQLAFNSSNSAFTVASGNTMASALMGAFNAGGATPATAGAAAGVIQVAGGSSELGTAATSTTAAASTDLSLLAPITVGTQAVTINAVDASGNQHSLTVNLAAANTTSLSAALDAINTALQKSDDTTLQQITAVQTGNTSGTTFNFVSTLPSFTVSVGADATANTEGVNTATAAAPTVPTTPAQTAMSMTAVQVGTGSTADISTLAGATSAVSAVSAAVGALGNAQAAIGIGENQLNYAINLASSQITNFSAAESQIRDANVAQEAANLTQAQTLQQASIAAMAQANSAPQAILSLLKS
jgi:flagellin